LARRKPKELTSQPTVFESVASGAGGSPLIRGGRAPVGGQAHLWAPATVMTDEAAELVRPNAHAPGDQRAVHASALRIASRLSIPRPRRDASARRGVGQLRSVWNRDGVDEIDLDRTLEVLVEMRAPRAQDIVVRERVRARRSVVLAVDVSGSMRGERIRTAAAAMGALAAELRDEDLAVLAFWSDAAWLAHRGRASHAPALLDMLLGLPVRGLTNVGFPLELAARELARVPARDARVILLSDCVHNAGPDPRAMAARLPRLDILLDVNGEHDLEMGRELAKLGRGRVHRVRDHRDVAPALSNAFLP
jgi:Mg-chelatase subunit ChlD